MSIRKRPRVASRRDVRRPAPQRRQRRLAQDHQPGTVSSKLRRQMGDAIADLFDEVGRDFYADALMNVKDVLSSIFEEKLGALSGTVKEELGRRGLEESARHFHGFMNELVSDLVQYGLEDISASVEDIASTMAAQYGSDDEFGAEGDDILEVSPDEVEEVEEVSEEEVEPVEEDLGDEDLGEEAEPAAEGEEDLEDLFGTDEEAAAHAVDARRPKRRRPRPSRRQVHAEEAFEDRKRRAKELVRRLRRPGR